MSKKWTFALILCLGSMGTLQANPLDSPDIVYIDGSPCNRACQSYMAWSAQALSGRYREQHETYVAPPAEPEIARPQHVSPARAVRQPAPVARTAPHAGKAASNGSTAPNSKKIAAPNATPQTPRKEVPAVSAALPPQRAVGETTAAIQKPDPKAENSGRPEAQATAVAASKSPQTPTSDLKPEAKSGVTTAVALPPPATLEIAAPSTSVPAATSNKTREIGKTASGSPDDLDNLVALVLARPEINSLSDLNNKNIAITEKQSASSGRVSAALMAAGAAEVQFSEVKASAIERLINGEVPAAVVLAPRDVANLFPEIDGFRTFRVPLAQKARL